VPKYGIVFRRTTSLTVNTEICTEAEDEKSRKEKQREVEGWEGKKRIGGKEKKRR